MTDSDEILVLPSDETEGDDDYVDVAYEDVGDDGAGEDAPKRRLLWPLLIGVGVLIGFAIAFAASWYTRPAPFDASALEARIADLQTEVTALQNRPEPVMPKVNLAPLTQRIVALEARPRVDPLSEEIVARMEALQADGFQVPVMPDLPDFDAVEARLNGLEDQVQAQALTIAALPVGGTVVVAPETEPFIDADTLPRFPAQILREGASELVGSGFIRRTFSRHVRVRGSNAPDVLISGIEDDLANGKPRAALAKFDRLPPQIRSLARAWRANMEDALL
ncbi:hypothetical protein GCM10009069_01700 [Algimonas arctica]|uniref:Uncharacterized protein n=1 Tax=Algimonas arctica TaxID=1479486 RepID=A0A8J3CKE9_9PROT|nr:hypothetical protein [Algimonas arctica]GHA82235.1 hypothetical protein GCM10009069_01700 [Algimonas arctica]